ncbi:MAG: DUF4417 domain-containing protein [Melioribacteraceae bacterium]|jgi:hypothetical protein|nr:DUF4417 domain-containing protein [Melioribacteraceae bacterium]
MIRKKILIRLNEFHFLNPKWDYTIDDYPIILSNDDLILNKKVIIPIIHKVKHPEDYIACFYIDDFQFERFWNNPRRYLKFLSSYYAVIGSDFSIYTNTSLPVKLYNLYRNVVLTRLWQDEGINVIPNLSWPIGQLSSIYTDPYCKAKTVCISNIGLNKEEKYTFYKELHEIDKHLNFNHYIIYGTFDNNEINYLLLEKTTHIKQYINARK